MKPRYSLLLLLLVVVLMPFVTGGSTTLNSASRAGSSPIATVLHVPQDYATIGAALEAAPSGAVIVVAPGRYDEQLQIKKPVTLQAESEGTIIGQGSISIMADEVTVSGFTLLPGKGKGIWAG